MSMAVLLQMKRSEAIQFIGDQQMLSSYANHQLSLLENCLVLLHVDNELPELHLIIKTVPSNSKPGAQLRGHRRYGTVSLLHAHGLQCCIPTPAMRWPRPVLRCHRG